MAWIYLAESAESQLPSTHGLGQSLTVSKTDTLSPYFFQECQKESYIEHQSGTTLKPFAVPNSLKSTLSLGGFPCQDLSVAGRGEGLAGERSGLFYEIVRLTKETRTPFVFLENVPAIRTRGLREVIRAFTEIGYDCRWTCLSAASVGDPHKRERWFLLAYSNSNDLRNSDKSKCEAATKLGNNGSPQSMAYTMRSGLEGQRSFSIGNKSELSDIGDNSWWSIEPSVGRVVNGLQYRPHRIKCLGNSVVPQQVREAFKILSGLKEGEG